MEKESFVRVKKKDFLFLSYGLFCLGLIILKIWLSIEPAVFVKNDNMPIVGANIFGPLNLLCFYTYWSLIFYTIWLLGLGVSGLCKLNKIYEFLNNRNVMFFIVFNEIITLIMFSIYKVGDVLMFSGNLKSIFSLDEIQSLIVHYVVTISAIILWSKMEVRNFLKKKSILLLYIFPVIFFGVMIILGRFVFVVEWYPYIVCSPKTFWNTAFGSMNNYNTITATFLLIGLFVATIFLVYAIGLKLIKSNNKKYIELQKINAQNEKTT